MGYQESGLNNFFLKKYLPFGTRNLYCELALLELYLPHLLYIRWITMNRGSTFSRQDWPVWTSNLHCSLALPNLYMPYIVIYYESGHNTRIRNFLTYGASKLQFLIAYPNLYMPYTDISPFYFSFLFLQCY